MMRTAEDLLQELAALDESHRIEAKQARQIDRSVMETVCAFANEPGLGGGYLLLGGVRDVQDLFTNAYRIEGIDKPNPLCAGFDVRGTVGRRSRRGDRGQSAPARPKYTPASREYTPAPGRSTPVTGECSGMAASEDSRRRNQTTKGSFAGFDPGPLRLARAERPGNGRTARRSRPKAPGARILEPHGPRELARLHHPGHGKSSRSALHLACCGH